MLFVKFVTFCYKIVTFTKTTYLLLTFNTEEKFFYIFYPNVCFTVRKVPKFSPESSEYADKYVASDQYFLLQLYQFCPLGQKQLSDVTEM